MLQPSDLKIKTESESATFGKYVLEPLPAGYGHTLGNSLRRMLIGSIPGSAIISAKFSGANHQFTTIAGIKEDVIDIILNLKQLHFKLEGNDPVVVTINSKGSGAITASDLDLPDGVAVANPKQVIATIGTKGAKLEAEFVVAPGVGYEPAEEHETNKIGVIAIDSVFTPVISANYKIEPARVGQRSDFDRLILEITTNGTIAPRAALTVAAKQLEGFFARVTVEKESLAESPSEELQASKNQKRQIEASEVLLDELNLPTRTINALKRSELKTLADLASLSDEEILKIKNLGEKSVVEITEILKKEGLR
jgi:DNA-directed RNA polymerase subunit alpha